MFSREFVVKKQLRCSYTGEQRSKVSSSGKWMLVLCNNEICVLSLNSGEIIGTITVNANFIQRLASTTLSSLIISNINNDQILIFTISNNSDNFIVFSTRNQFIKIIKIEFNKNTDIPNNIILYKEFKHNMGLNTTITSLIFDLTDNLIIAGAGNGDIRV